MTTLERLRVDAGLTAAELARRAKVKRHTIRDIEQGRRRRRPLAPTMHRLAAALGVAPEQLMADAAAPRGGDGA